MSFAVGILDWGIGGLGTYRLLRARCPKASILYWSDTGAVPYGKLPRRALAERVQSAIDSMRALGAARIVVACNAASTVLSDLELDLPCLGVIEAGIASVPRALCGTLAVLGGARTIRSGIYQRALSRPGLRVQGRIAQPLSAHIEAGRMGTKAFREDLARVMGGVGGADAILWACTHYPAAAAAFRPLAPHALWLDPAQALVERIARFPLYGAGEARFLTTGDPRAMAQAARAAWGLTLPAVERVRLSARVPR